MWQLRTTQFGALIYTKLKRSFLSTNSTKMNQPFRMDWAVQSEGYCAECTLCDACTGPRCEQPLPQREGTVRLQFHPGSTVSTRERPFLVLLGPGLSLEVRNRRALGALLYALAPAQVTTQAQTHDELLALDEQLLFALKWQQFLLKGTLPAYGCPL